MTILVTGSTGHVGSAVVKELGKRKVSIRALVREPDAKLPEGVQAVVGDLLDPVSIDKALDGVDKLYLLNAVVPDELTQGLIAFGLAKKRKLKHIVYHSVFKADHFKGVRAGCRHPLAPGVIDHYFQVQFGKPGFFQGWIARAA